VITRDDGTKQWAYKGKPLYYFSMDKAAGDKAGDGRGMVWHVATP
jgi:predicted lipoprotein with Yx(FWY)xxD motif